MMTTMAALLGTLPIALGFGAGLNHAGPLVLPWSVVFSSRRH